jgi:hypothetical protein
MFVAALWFVNLVNFMDGIDLMTVADLICYGWTWPLRRDGRASLAALPSRLLRDKAHLKFVASQAETDRRALDPRALYTSAAFFGRIAPPGRRARLGQHA